MQLDTEGGGRVTGLDHRALPDVRTRQKSSRTTCRLCFAFRTDLRSRSDTAAEVFFEV